MVFDWLVLQKVLRISIFKYCWIVIAIVPIMCQLIALVQETSVTLLVAKINLPLNLFFIYFSSLFWAIGYFTISSQAPKLIVEFSDFEEFTKKKLSYNDLVIYILNAYRPIHFTGWAEVKKFHEKILLFQEANTEPSKVYLRNQKFNRIDDYHKEYYAANSHFRNLRKVDLNELFNFVRNLSSKSHFFSRTLASISLVLGGFCFFVVFFRNVYFVLNNFPVW